MPKSLAIRSPTRWRFEIAAIWVRKVWVSIKFLSAKFGFYSPPPPEKGPKNEEKLSKSVEILKIDTFPGGGGEGNCMDKTILWTSGRF